MEQHQRKKYDWLVVGGGLFGAVFTYYALRAGKSVLVVERRPQLGGNVRCEQYNGVTVHAYGAHIFHSDDKANWDFVNSIVPLTPILHSPVAVTASGRAYSLPFNMYTFSAMWPDVVTPEQARAKIAEQTRKWVGKKPSNLEEMALSTVGEDIYEALIKGYTEKQWGRPCAALPAEIMKRIPLRFTYDNSYFYCKYVGVPEGGYNPLIDHLFRGAEVVTGTDYLSNRGDFAELANDILFTGCIDEFFDYAIGRLEYRSLAFETKILPLEKSQGCSVVNYTGADVPYTRIIEHNAFAPKKYYEEIVISREYPTPYSGNNEPYYPVIDEKNRRLYEAYCKIAQTHPNVHFGGRLGLFEYLDMDDVLTQARQMANRLLLY